MKNHEDPRIEAYLDQAMPAAERKAFETELAADPALRAQLRLHRLANAAIEADAMETVRRKVKEVRLRRGPLPEPKITLPDRIRLFFYSKWNRLIAYVLSAVAVLLGAWLVAAMLLCPVSRIQDTFFIEPVMFARAGTEAAAAPASALDQSREHYKHNRIDMLLQLSGDPESSSVATYYLAHRYLKNGEYALAEWAFAAALADREQLRAYPELQDMGALKFNLLLSRLGYSKDFDAALAGLASLKNDPAANGNMVRTKAAALEAELQNPLLRILCLN